MSKPDRILPFHSMLVSEKHHGIIQGRADRGWPLAKFKNARSRYKHGLDTVRL